MNGYIRGRYFNLLILCISLLIGSSLQAERRNHILKVDVAGLEVSNLNQALWTAVNSINEEVIVPAMKRAFDANYARVGEANKQIIADFKKRGQRYGPNDLVKIPFIRRPDVHFNQTDFGLHMTLAYIGDLNDGDERYNAIVNAVKEAVRRALNEWSISPECRPLEFRAGALMWPPRGTDRKIWLEMKVEPASPEIRKSLLALLNRIQTGLQKIQTTYKDYFFTDKFYRKTTFNNYKDFSDGQLHISLGRLEPAYETFDVRLENGNIKQVSELTANDRVAVDTQGDPVLVRNMQAKSLMMDLTDDEQRQVLNILQVRGNQDMLNGMTPTQRNFSMNAIGFSSKVGNDTSSIQSFGLRCVNIANIVGTFEKAAQDDIKQLDKNQGGDKTITESAFARLKLDDIAENNPVLIEMLQEPIGNMIEQYGVIRDAILNALSEQENKPVEQKENKTDRTQPYINAWNDFGMILQKLNRNQPVKTIVSTFGSQEAGSSSAVSGGGSSSQQGPLDEAFSKVQLLEGIYQDDDSDLDDDDVPNTTIITAPGTTSGGSSSSLSAEDAAQVEYMRAKEVATLTYRNHQLLKFYEEALEKYRQYPEIVSDANNGIARMQGSSSSSGSQQRPAPVESSAIQMINQASKKDINALKEGRTSGMRAAVSDLNAYVLANNNQRSAGTIDKYLSGMYNAFQDGDLKAYVQNLEGLLRHIRESEKR